MVKLVGTAPGATVMVSPLAPTLKLVTDSVLSTSLSLLSTLPVVVLASSRIVKVSAFRTESSSTMAMLTVAVYDEAEVAVPSLTLKLKVAEPFALASGLNCKRPSSMSLARIVWLAVTFCHTPSASLNCKLPLNAEGRVVMTTA